MTLGVVETRRSAHNVRIATAGEMQTLQEATKISQRSLIFEEMSPYGLSNLYTSPYFYIPLNSCTE
jgi:hypothetical protein